MAADRLDLMKAVLFRKSEVRIQNSRNFYWQFKTKKSWKHRVYDLSIFFIFEFYGKPDFCLYIDITTWSNLTKCSLNLSVGCFSNEISCLEDRWRISDHVWLLNDSTGYTWILARNTYLIYFVSICFFFCQHHHLVEKIGHRVFITSGILEFSGLPMMIRWKNTMYRRIRYLVCPRANIFDTDICRGINIQKKAKYTTLM